MAKTYSNRAKDKQEVKAITDQLEEGLKELFESEKYKRYLSMMSKFHNYSANNIQLITMQCPDATFVAGYLSYFSDKNPYPCFIVIFLNRCFFYKSGHYRMVCSDNFWLRYNSMYGLC